MQTCTDVVEVEDAGRRLRDGQRSDAGLQGHSQGTLNELGKTACAGSACELARGRGLGDWLSLLEEWRFTVQDRIGLLILFPKKLDFINFPFRLLITLYF
ncbi:hypothetical protein BDA96_02G138700 [Sorghum bicolor]|uniref:Uncharacterized protein n=2 Tax=Sorghum bicolor TaxID=4558 RepID=A0A921RM44_SORBI|nr:hypothetical protein BDA96_02G138700 [Sorghum bicolor]KXG35099.1 hypothetical protein SORBI_3002G132100 [Sorghum bicolor]